MIENIPEKQFVTEKKSDFETIKQEILEQSRELEPEIIENYTKFHENPELGGEEIETAKIIKEYLQKLGIEIIGDKIGKTGLVAIIKGEEDGPTVALRADMDALPIEESKQNNPRSNNSGVMHACGHDTHVAGLLGAAKILKKFADDKKLKGNIVLLFQSNEEQAKHQGSGAAKLVKFLEEKNLREKIKAFFGMHIWGELERGKVQLTNGVQMAGSGRIDIKLESKGGHGKNIKTLPDLDMILSELKIKLSREFEEYWDKGEALIDSMRPDFKTNAINIMPEKGERAIFLRITSLNYKQISQDVLEKIELIVTETVEKEIKKSKFQAKKKGVERNEDDFKIKTEIKKHPGYRPVIHRDNQLVNLTNEAAQAVLENYERISEKTLAAEDFSFYLEEFREKEIPGVYLLLGGASPKKNIPTVSNHSPNFKIDPDVIKDMSAIHSLFVMKYFNMQVTNQKI